jgi:hypothetical protein
MTSQERADFWQQQLTAWLASGISGHAFCKHQALVYHQFAYWRKKLAPPTTVDSLAGFASVTLPTTVAINGGLTITLPNGMAISGLHPGNIDCLGAIMRQL